MEPDPHHLRNTLLCILIGISISVVQAGKLNANNTFSIRLENDAVAGSDGDYTAGVEFVWTHAHRTSLEELEQLPLWYRQFSSFMPIGQINFDTVGSSISLGQQIYTPQDIETAALLPNDRPYAGWSYLNIAVHGRSENHLDSMTFTVGVIGPDSYASDVQRGLHEIIDSTPPNGWDNQLKNELGLNLYFLHDRRFWKRTGSNEFEIELIDSTQLALGNVDTRLSYGWRLRAGRQLPSDFKLGKIRHADPGFEPEDHYGIFAQVAEPTTHLYFELQVSESYVARNIFLEGNTFRDSHSVKKRDWVSEISAGFTYGKEDFRTSFLYTYRTQEFSTQNDGAAYGSITFSFRI